MFGSDLAMPVLRRKVEGLDKAMKVSLARLDWPLLGLTQHKQIILHKRAILEKKSMKLKTDNVLTYAVKGPASTS